MRGKGPFPGDDKLDRYVVVLWGTRGAIKANKMRIVSGDNAEGLLARNDAREKGAFTTLGHIGAETFVSSAFPRT